ncbi:MAG: hypothetical protein ACP5PT_04335 [Brevinematia bacterium]
MRKKIIFVFAIITIFLLNLNLFAAFTDTYEHINLYEDTLSKGLGNATTSIDWLGTASFLANPASSVGSKFSMELVLINLSLNQTSLQFGGEISRILSSGSQNDLFGLIIDQIGNPFNLGVKLNLLNFNIPVKDYIGLNFGILSSVKFFLEFHNPLSSAGLGDLLGFIGIIPYVGVSYSLKRVAEEIPLDYIKEHLRNINLGLNFKFAILKGVNRKITLGDLAAGKLEEILKEELGSITNSLVSIIPDIGILYKIPLYQEKEDNIKIGLSIKDIGGFEIGSEKYPTKFNLGASYNFTLPNTGNFLKKNSVSIEIQDLFFQLKDKDFFKRLHIGVISEILNLSDALTLNLALGINQGYPTFGTQLKLAVFKFAYSVSAEELGVYAGQDPDIRHNFSLSIGW